MENMVQENQYDRSKQKTQYLCRVQKYMFMFETVFFDKKFFSALNWKVKKIDRELS